MGGFPFSIKLVIPIGGFSSFGIGDLRFNVIVSLRLEVLGIINVSFVDPVGRLGDGGVRDLLGLKDVPVFLDTSGASLVVVNQHFKGVVGLDNESVDVGDGVSLGGYVFFDEVVLAVLGQDDVGSASRSTNIRAEHDTGL